MWEITNITANFVSASTNNPMSTISFNTVLEKFRKESFSERDKGFRFEKLMQAYLKTTPLYSNLFGKVWLWNEFPCKKDFGGKDIGIDLVVIYSLGAYSSKAMIWYS